MTRPTLRAAALFLAAVSAAPAFQPGERCFANRTQVPLLAAPDRTAAPVARAPWGAELAILGAQGRWLQVRSGKTQGWVYAGNVSLEKPPAENKSDILPTAGETGAAVAARPLSSAAKDYASRTSHGEALAHLQWLETTADALPPASVTAYQQENRRGEFAP
jgi:hypothetical protein